MNAKEWNDNVLKVSVIISDNVLSMPVLDFLPVLDSPPKMNILPHYQELAPDLTCLESTLILKINLITSTLIMVLTDMAVIVQSLKITDRITGDRIIDRIIERITGQNTDRIIDRITGQIAGDRITGDRITDWIKDRITDHMAQTFSTITDPTLNALKQKLGQKLGPKDMSPDLTVKALRAEVTAPKAIVIITQRSQVITQRSLVITQRSQVIAQRSQVITQRSQALALYMLQKARNMHR